MTQYHFRRITSKKARVGTPAPSVTVMKGGKSIGVTQTALALIGNPDAVFYQVDENARAFALEPADAGAIGAYPVRWQESKRSAVISFGNIGQMLGIDRESDMVRIQPKLVDGVLVVDLTEVDNGAGDGTAGG